MLWMRSDFLNFNLRRSWGSLRVQNPKSHPCLNLGEPNACLLTWRWLLCGHSLDHCWLPNHAEWGTSVPSGFWTNLQSVLALTLSGFMKVAEAVTLKATLEEALLFTFNKTFFPAPSLSLHRLSHCCMKASLQHASLLGPLESSYNWNQQGNYLS